MSIIINWPNTNLFVFFCLNRMRVTLNSSTFHSTLRLNACVCSFSLFLTPPMLRNFNAIFTAGSISKTMWRGKNEKKKLRVCLKEQHCRWQDIRRRRGRQEKSSRASKRRQKSQSAASSSQYYCHLHCHHHPQYQPRRHRKHKRSSIKQVAAAWQGLPNGAASQWQKGGQLSNRLYTETPLTVVFQFGRQF